MPSQILFIALLFTGFLSSCEKTVVREQTQESADILICEQASNRIMLMDSTVDWASEEAVIWSWSPKDDPSLAAEQKGWFRNLDEAKPVRNGTQIVVTASGGGAALIDFESARAIAAIHLGGSPHSAERLPDGRIVVASSNGDSVSLWDPLSNEVIQKVDLIDTHGLEWDRTREALWALGGKQLVRYDYDLESSRLQPALTIDLPVTEASKQYPRHGGHDLTRIPGEDAYFVSDMDHLWRFDCSKGILEPLPERHEMKKVKSISQLGSDGPVLVLQATQNWHATGPRTLDEAKIWHLPKARIYKARWWVPNEAQP